MGKTTVTRALGIEASRQGHRTAIVELNHEQQLSRMMGLQAAAFGPTSLDTHLDLFCLNPIQCLHNFGSVKLGSKRLVKLLLGHRVIDTLVDSVPGLHDLFQLGKIHHLLTDNGPDQPYDKIFVDTPSTGHALTLFSAAKSIQEMMRVGLVYDEAKAIADTIADPDMCASLTVSLAESLPIQETIHFLQERGEGHPAHAGIVLNRWISVPLLTEDQRVSLTKVVHSQANPQLNIVFEELLQRHVTQTDVVRQIRRAVGRSVPLFSLENQHPDVSDAPLLEAL